jgi:hypothetical protein
MDSTRSSPRPKDGASRAYSLRLAGDASLTGRNTVTEAKPAAADIAVTELDGAATGGLSLRIDPDSAIAAQLDPESRRVFEEAVATLRALKAGRAQVEAKLAETGRQDAIRTVTGISAMDAAIEQTEAMIRSLAELARSGR